MSTNPDLTAAILTSNSTLLAAIITGAIAALVFLVGEVLKIWREHRDRQNAAVLALLASWEDIARISAPRSERWWSWLRVYSERVDITMGWTRLAAVLPPRDFELITLQARLNDQLVSAPNDRKRLTAAAEATVALTIWLASRSKGRQHARFELGRQGVTHNFDSSPVSSAP